jgi:hypothetical protein
MMANRCASYFTVFKYPQIKKWLSDGGTWEIQPGRIGLCENRAIRYRDGDHAPDELAPAYVVSLGTGSSKLIGDRPHHADGFWGMVVRMWDFFNSRFHGQRSWRDLVLDNPVLHSQGKLFRFDVEFDGKGPSLDNIDRMPEMKALAFGQYASSPALHDLELAVGVDMFYFELRCPTRDDMDEVIVAGRVMCRWKSPKRHFQAWLRYVRTSKIRVIVEGQSKGHLDVDQHGNLVRNVDLRIKSLQSRLSIQIQIGSEKRRHIGGSPFCVATLAEVQGLDTPFRGPEVKRKRGTEITASSRKQPRWA